MLILMLAAALISETGHGRARAAMPTREAELDALLAQLRSKLASLTESLDMMEGPPTTTTTTTTRDPEILRGRLKTFVENELEVPPSRTLIFTAVTRGFIPSLVNWMALLYRLDLYSVFVFAMDDESYKWLTDHGFASYRGGDVPPIRTWAAKGGNKFKRMQVWYERSFIVMELLRLGYNVVQSDGDALWLQNPMHEFDELLESYDVIFSRGNARSGFKGRGTGVCMGLVMYKASEGAIGFLQDIINRMPVANDVDQGIANTFVGGVAG